MDFLQNTFNYWTNELDPRVADLPLVGSSYLTPLIVFAYLYFVLVCGPNFMKNRPPYTLKTFIQLYNIIQILGNTWLIYYVLSVGLFSQKLVCPVLDYSYEYFPMRIVRFMWYFYLLKILDYVETGIFILRKKDNQVSILHIYHHVSTLFFAWTALRYYALYPLAFLILFNCFIHSIMYTYYFLAACGPSGQKLALFMKQWITVVQMIQFVIFISYGLQSIVPDCLTINKWTNVVYSTNVLINFYNFYNFYQETYKKLKKN